jgi:prolyl-tRNA synthetase
LNKNVKSVLGSIQKDLLLKSRKDLKEGTKEVKDYKELKEKMKKEKGFFNVYWCGNPDCESKIKKDTKATVRCFSEETKKEGKCIYCGKKTKKKWIFAQSY